MNALVSRISLGARSPDWRRRIARGHHRRARPARGGGYGGHLAHPEGFLRKVVTAPDGQPPAE